MSNHSKHTETKKSPLGKRSSALANLGVVHPSSHYHYCPRCAAKGDFNDQQFSFKCQACGFHFFLNSAAAVTALIFNKHGELLITRRGIEPEIGKIDLPGGFIDPNESAEQALMRELKEELDLQPDKITYYGSFPNQYLYSGTIVYTVDLVFRCHVPDFSSLKFRDDIAGGMFIKPEDIDLNEVPFVSVRNVIESIINEQSNTK